MARRQHQFFGNLSFLDVVFGALGSILFLFIVVDKGGVQEQPLPEKFIKVYMDLDTAKYQFHGALPDSIKAKLDTLKPGTAVMLVINSVNLLPACPACDSCCPRSGNTGGGFYCPNPKDHENVCQDKNAHKFKPCLKPDDHFNVCKDISVHRKILCEDPKCNGQKPVVYTGDPIELPYKIGFSIIDSTFANDIDIKICRSGICVPEGREENGGGMRWIDLRERGFWMRRARTGGEIVLVERELIPGEYIINCKFDVPKRRSGSTTITATAATKIRGQIKSVIFTTALVGGQTWAPIGKVRITANGDITKMPI